MNRLIFGLMGGFLVLTVLFVGCATKTTLAPAAPTQNVTGTLKDANTPAEAGKDVVTVETPQGLQTFLVTSNTTYTLEGKICSLEDINKAVEAANVSYNCTLVYDEELGAIGVYVTKK